MVACSGPGEAILTTHPEPGILLADVDNACPWNWRNTSAIDAGNHSQPVRFLSSAEPSRECTSDSSRNPPDHAICRYKSVPTVEKTASGKMEKNCRTVCERQRASVSPRSDSGYR